MPYKSGFTYVDELPADSVKVTRVRDKTPRELYWSDSNKKFYCRYMKNDKVSRIREMMPGKKGYVYARSTEGKSICIVMSKWMKQLDQTLDDTYIELAKDGALADSEIAIEDE